MTSKIGFLSLCIGLALSSQAASAPTATDRYCDKKLLYCLSYPKGSMTRVNPADFKDGAVFQSNDNGMLLISVVEPKAPGQSVQSKLNDFIRSYAGSVIKSKVSNGSGYAVSGIHKGAPFYERLVLNQKAQLFVHVYIATSQRYADAHASLIQQITSSLTVQDGAPRVASPVAARPGETPRL